MTGCIGSASCKIPGKSRDKLQQTSVLFTKFVSVQVRHFYVYEIWDFSHGSTQCIPQMKLTTSDWYTAYHWTVGNPCNLMLYAVGFLFSRMCKLAVSNTILPRSKQYVLQDFPHRLVIIFRTSWTTASCGCKHTSVRCMGIWIKLNDSHFIQATTCWVAEAMQNQICSPQRCKDNYLKYSLGRIFKNSTDTRQRENKKQHVIGWELICTDIASRQVAI